MLVRCWLQGFIWVYGSGVRCLCALGLSLFANIIDSLYSLLLCRLL